ncbi:uncharacterized protein LOC734388 [Xenopus laevis]|uniref:MGC115334 protein n=1 Tax=Xenopus laevis TaxID=8355 RepID=Q58E09_XENLA|nr:uncharacterized protein LOC734388 [Xenopus laevis]AAH92120.1 MGC115334 protein [Xenopus laevis]
MDLVSRTSFPVDEPKKLQIKIKQESDFEYDENPMKNHTVILTDRGSEREPKVKSEDEELDPEDHVTVMKREMDSVPGAGSIEIKTKVKSETKESDIKDHVTVIKREIDSVPGADNGSGWNYKTPTSWQRHHNGLVEEASDPLETTKKSLQESVSQKNPQMAKCRNFVANPGQARKFTHPQIFWITTRNPVQIRISSSCKMDICH